MSKITQQFVCALAALLIAFGLPSKADVKTHATAITAKVKKKHKHHLDVRKVITKPVALVEHFIHTHFGYASWYGPGFEGATTATGRTFSTWKPMCARKTGTHWWPYHAWVRVTNTLTGKSALCQIEDNGPLAPGRIIDLSRYVADKIGMYDMAPVKVSLVSVH